MSEAAGAPHWDLSLLYEYGSPRLEADLRKIRSLGCDFPLWRERLAAPDFSPAEFDSLLSDLAHIQEFSSRLSGYSTLYFSEDTANQKAQSFVGMVDSQLVELENSLLFFQHWWKHLEADRAEEFLRAVPRLEYYLRRIRAFKPYTLSEAEERIINYKDVTGSEALVVIYDTITNRYRFRTDFLPGGAEGRVSREELMVHARSHLPEAREGAYREFYRVFGEEGPTLALIFQSLARDWRVENVTLRGYRGPREARNVVNDLPEHVVESLLRVSESETPRVFGEYFRKKAEALKLPRLRRYDVYAPLAPAPEREIPFSEALEEVRKAFSSFSPRMAEAALNVYEKRHLSAARLPGKESGAYCASLDPDDAPWVLMTYKGRRQDIFTLAHELGHAVHSQLAAGRGIFQFHAALPLAETASTFGEMLLASSFRRKNSDPLVKNDLLFHLLDDAYATVGRQAFFSLFEAEAHDMVEGGATAGEISAAYFKNLQRQFGDSVELSPEFAWEWVSIPHFFHTPFYVYAYTFGQLLVYSLYRRYEIEGEAFVPRFLGILSQGGAASPVDILNEAGVGPLDDDFWKGGFEVIESFIKELD
ncbi:MAG: M3 family oligoendopeptidase [Deltaproteobacteria bacterium]|jgi:oligoendopeptidase F|nr:M3 family oligoendopeptidase [Deltaproteobacteria bacterium]